MTASLSAFSFETIQAGLSPIGLTQATFAPTSGVAQKAFITIEGEARYTYHPGGEPSPTLGHLLRDGGYLVLHGELQMRNFKVVSTGIEPVNLTVSYERP